jgi:hypothetical protein
VKKMIALVKKQDSALAALATGAIMALAPVAAQAGTVTVSGRINDGNGSAVSSATCTIEFASYDGETIITTASDSYNDAAYSAELPGDKEYRVWCMQNNGSICGEAILDLNGVTGPVTNQNYGMHSPSYSVTYNGDDKRYFLSLDFAQAFAARTPSAESLESVPGGDSKILSTLVGRDWTYAPPIALRSTASSDVYAFLKPTSADASNSVECTAFTTGVRIPAGATTPEDAVTMSLKDTVADGQSIALSYEVELRATNNATAPLLTTPKVALPKSEFTLTVVGKTEDVEVTYDGEGHFITVNTNGLSRVIYDGTKTNVEEVSVKYSYEKDGSYHSKRWTPILTNACVKTVVYYTIGNTKAYVNVYKGSAPVTIRPRPITLKSGDGTWEADGTAHSNATVTVGGDGFVDGQGATYSGFAEVMSEGVYSNTFAVTFNDGTFASNYTNTFEYGRLEITLSIVIREETTEETIFECESTGTSTVKITGLKSTAQVGTELVIPDKIGGKFVTEIARGAFANSKCGATSVKLPLFCTTIGFRAFSGFSTLTSVTFTQVRDWRNVASGVPATLTIGEYAFAGCGLTSLALPGSVAKVGDYAFANCASLTSATIEGEPAMGKYPFRRTGVNATSGASEACAEGRPVVVASATTFCGWLTDASGAVAGTITLKAAKPTTNRRTGATKQRWTAAVVVAGETRKISLSGTVDPTGGAFALTKKKEARTLEVFVEDASASGTSGSSVLVSGTFGDYDWTAAADVFTSTAAADRTTAAAALAAWKGTSTLSWSDAVGTNALKLKISAKGKAKVTGTLSDGTRVSVSAQLIVAEDGTLCVPVVQTKKNAPAAFGLALSGDGEDFEAF